MWIWFERVDEAALTNIERYDFAVLSAVTCCGGCASSETLKPSKN